MNKDNIIYNKYIYAIIIMLAFVIFFGGCEGNTNNIDTNISKIAREDGISKSAKILKTLLNEENVDGLYPLSEEDIELLYMFDVMDYNDYCIYTSILPTSTTEIAIVDVSNEEEVKTIEDRFRYRVNYLKEVWKEKDAKEYFKLNDAIIKTTHSYVVLIIADNQDEIYNKLEEMLVELSE